MNEATFKRNWETRGLEMAEIFSDRSKKDTFLYANRGQGELTKDQYIQRIRELCGEISYQSVGQKDRSKRNRVWKDSASSKPCSHNGVFAGDKNRGFTTSLQASTSRNYFVDDEQPTDPESFSSMVNYTTADPRILPAVVETVRYLRQTYHQLLLSMRPKSFSFFEKERENLGTRSDSSEEHFSSLSDDTNSAKVRVSLPYNQNSTRHRKKRANSTLSSSSNSSASLGNHQLIRRSVTGSCDKWSGSDRHRFRRVTFDTVNLQKNDQPYELHAAASEGDTDEVMMLTLNGCDLNAPDSDGFPAFEFALRRSKFRCAIFLVEAGTDIDMYTRKKLKEYETLLRKSRSYMHVMKTTL